MPDKLTYEELELRVRELEKTESERTKTEEGSHLKSALLEAQLASSIDGVLVVDAHGKKILQNQRTVDLFKIPQHIADNDDDGPQVQHVINMTKNPEQFIKRTTHLYKHPEEKSQDETELKDGTVLDRYSAPAMGKDGQYYGRVWTFHDITERKQAEGEREQLIKDLQKALSEVKTLQGFLPICGFCKKIRNDDGYWDQIELYISKHSDTEFSHGMCPECLEKHFPEHEEDKD